MAEGDVIDVPCMRQCLQPSKLGLRDGGGCSSCSGAAGGLTVLRVVISVIFLFANFLMIF